MAEPAGRAAADEARDILTKLGASVLVERLDRLTGAPAAAAAASPPEGIEAAVGTPV
jgi:hypothetical protein